MKLKKKKEKKGKNKLKKKTKRGKNDKNWLSKKIIKHIKNTIAGNEGEKMKN